MITGLGDDTAKIESWLDALLQQLTPVARRKMLREVATALRKQQQNTIGQQKNPDGSAFVPRKLRARQGRIKGKMFMKLRTSAFLKTVVTPDSASVFFDGRVQHIAQVHHYGLRDKVSPRGPVVQYTRRQLLGMNPASQALIRQLLLTHLSR
ncbi:phage virion morphogenesis protein [Citrobacter portucalensis]|uniref:phage virion morphogenesis protein n=1 Tax=Citrobacter portucalensis TaxID=1639133 RepID=UPI00226BAD54|nr:phage virion morphogenesis protein [Citrobacter portucalensis]MCX9038822.1 phage virion morphogenesis protein [Citrobacter portucalensis]